MKSTKFYDLLVDDLSDNVKILIDYVNVDYGEDLSKKKNYS